MGEPKTLLYDGCAGLDSVRPAQGDEAGALLPLTE